MKAVMRLWVFTGLLALSGCGSTNTIMVGQSRPATTADMVRVYYTPPRHYERIALINSQSGPTWAFTTRGQMEDAISKLREEAAKVGANGVLIEATGTRSSGNLGIGVGGFGGGGGYHNGYEVGGGGAFGGPILHKTASATAIYVR
ncbi:MAG: hypothetical protein ACJ8M1_12040 [Chthoniobacterales bacterium]